MDREIIIFIHIRLKMFRADYYDILVMHKEKYWINGLKAIYFEINAIDVRVS